MAVTARRTAQRLLANCDVRNLRNLAGFVEVPKRRILSRGEITAAFFSASAAGSSAGYQAFALPRRCFRGIQQGPDGCVPIALAPVRVVKNRPVGLPAECQTPRGFGPHRLVSLRSLPLLV